MEEAFIVAGGPSLTGFKWDLLLGRYVIAINRSFQVLPFADIVYFSDYKFWQAYEKELLAHKGMKIRGWKKGSKALDNTPITNPLVKQYELTRQNKLEERAEKLSHGSNSTYAAINLCYHLGFKKIYLMGLDMRRENKSHWHEGYEFRTGKSSFHHMIPHFSSLLVPLKKHGIEVFNVNREKLTAIKCFPIIPHEEIFGEDCFENS